MLSGLTLAYVLQNEVKSTDLEKLNSVWNLNSVKKHHEVSEKKKLTIKKIKFYFYRFLVATLLIICTFALGAAQYRFDEDQFYEECEKGARMLYPGNSEMVKCVMKHLRETKFINNFRATGILTYFDPSDGIHAAARTEKCKVYRQDSKGITMVIVFVFIILIVVFGVVQKCSKNSRNFGPTTRV